MQDGGLKCNFGPTLPGFWCVTPKNSQFKNCELYQFKNHVFVFSTNYQALAIFSGSCFCWQGDVLFEIFVVQIAKAAILPDTAFSSV